MLLDPTTAGPPLRGAVRSRTLQEGPSSLRVDWAPKSYHGSHTARSGQAPHTPGGTEVDHGTFRRHFGLWVLASFARDASGIPCGGYA